MKKTRFYYKSLFLIGLCCLVFFPSLIFAQNQELEKAYSNWDKLLIFNINDYGLVDYESFKNGIEQLKVVTSAFSANPIQESWTIEEKKAYLINLYNAFTVQLVSTHYPVESIKDIGGKLTNVFKIEFIEYEDRLLSLDDVEKGLLLPLGDARVHFAINCASFSCPKLQNEAYLPNTLNAQLEQSAKSFINSDLNDISSNVLKLSKIFKWYSSDFIDNNSSLIDFLNRYSKEKISPNAKIKYLDYNWKLNTQ